MLANFYSTPRRSFDGNVMQRPYTCGGRNKHGQNVIHYNEIRLGRIVCAVPIMCERVLGFWVIINETSILSRSFNYDWILVVVAVFLSTWPSLLIITPYQTNTHGERITPSGWDWSLRC